MTRPKVRIAPSGILSSRELRAIHALMLLSFDGDFSDEDWEHTLGGTHFLIEHEGQVMAHASVVPRVLEIAGRAFRSGYIEGVATHPRQRGRGFGSAVVAAASGHIREGYELGALGTDLFDFYGRLGWERWLGPTYVRKPGGPVHSKDEDGYVMVLRFGASAGADLAASISCDERAGDDW